MTSISDIASLKTWANADGGTGTLTTNITISSADPAFPLTPRINSTLDGAGYTITIGSAERSPLFSAPASGSVTVQNLEVAVDPAGPMDGGVLFANVSNDDAIITVTDCAITSTSGSFILGTNIGGVVGGIDTSVLGYNINITGCYCTGTIGSNGGGIIGRNQSTGTGSLVIDKCYSTGNIGPGGGGIAGSGIGTSSGAPFDVKRSYSTGTIADNAGGIVGTDAVKCNINNCYSVGTMTGTGAGILAAGATSSGISINHCYSQRAAALGQGNGNIYGTVNSGTVTVGQNEAGGNSAEWNATVNGGGGDGLLDSQGPEPDNDIWDISGSFSTGFGLNRFNSSPWDGSTYTANTSEAEFESGGGGEGDPHITTLDGVQYDLITDGVFKLFDNNLEESRLVINADTIIPEHPIWTDKEYISTIYISYKGNGITIKPGFRGQLAQILDVDEDFENDEHVTITESRTKMDNCHKKFCSECKYRTRNNKLLMRHRRKAGHKLLTGIRNKIMVTIQDEYNTYNINVSNVNQDNFRPANVGMKIHDKRSYGTYTGAITREHVEYGCDVDNLHFISDISEDKEIVLDSDADADADTETDSVSAKTPSE